MRSKTSSGNGREGRVDTVISEVKSSFMIFEDRCSFSNRSLSSLISFLEESSRRENSVLTRSSVSRNSVFVTLSFSRASV